MFKLPAARRLPSLDGLRAISILLVMAYHIFGDSLGRFAIVGNLGVRIFFVISGFLITHLLLREMEATGRIDLKAFYKRRAFRIFPAFYTFLLCITLAWAIGWIPGRRTDFIQAATYTINYFEGSTHTIYVRHLWSLAVEEQFYLIWPATLMLLGRRWGMAAAASILLISPLCRVFYYLFIPRLETLVNSRFETVADALATGCLLAAVLGVLTTHRLTKPLLYSKAFYVVPVILFALTVVTAPHPRLYYGAGITVVNICIALCIARWVTQPGDLIGKILNFAPLSMLGVLSYSIYLWQQPFLMENGPAAFQHLPWSLLCAAVISCCSFFLIEQPMMRRRSGHSPTARPESLAPSKHPYPPQEAERASRRSGAA